MMATINKSTHTQRQIDYYADQNNPNNAAYKANRNNHSNQLNPNNPAFKSRRQSAK